MVTQAKYKKRRAAGGLKSRSGASFQVLLSITKLRF